MVTESLGKIEMNRKREKPYPSRHVPYSFPKRRHPPNAHDDSDPPAPKSPSTVVVTGIPPECSLLDLKSRFQIYGCISRTTMHQHGVAYVTFRSRDDAECAVAAARDTSFGITLHSTPVQVMWATDPVPLWREGVSTKDTNLNSSSSKLVRPEVPLSRHGKGKRLGSAIVNPRSENTDSVATTVPFRGREIVAYDDIL